MVKTGPIVTAAVTVFIALGAGHIMQMGWTQPPLEAATKPIIESRAPLPTRHDTSVLLAPRSSVPEPTIASVELTFPTPPPQALDIHVLPASQVARLIVPDDTVQVPLGDGEMNLDGFGMTCGTDVHAAAIPGALIRVEVKAACTPDVPVLVEYAGLTAAVGLDAGGTASVDLPAFSEVTDIAVRVGSEAPVHQTVRVPNATAYKRIAVAWSGSSPISVHALEFSATPGSAGHVATNRVRRDGSEGTVRRIGDPEMDTPRLAEIYSFPQAGAGRGGTVRISVTAEVTEENCGTVMELTVLQGRDGKPPDNSVTAIPVPGCNAVGDILVLKNLVQDLKIARNEASN